MTIIYFIIVLGILVFVHEFGHFVIAKWSNIYVEEFALGFGPAILKKQYGETLYRINMFPLGGFVKMRGDEDDVDDPRAFSKQSIFKRIAVVLAGPFMNILLAFILMPMVFMIGKSEPVYFANAPVIIGVRVGSPSELAGFKKDDRILSVGDEKTDTWKDVLKEIQIGKKPLKIEVLRGSKTIDLSLKSQGSNIGIEPEYFIGDSARVDRVMKDSPAEIAGIKSGDVILSIDGLRVGGWLDFLDRISQNKGEEIKIGILRDGKKIDFVLTPIFDKNFERWVVGIGKDEFSGIPLVKIKYPFVQAIKQGADESVRLVVMTLDVFKRLITFNLSYKVLGGPILIAKASAAAAQAGLAPLLYFIAFLSINLFILNLIPIPVLDGGQILFILIEGVIRRQIPMKVKAVASQTSFVLLMILMFLITVNDLDRIWNISRLWKWLF